MIESGKDETGPIAFGELSEIDLDSLDHLDDEELAGHFRSLAGRATEGQLREVLEVGHGEAGGHEVLIDSYVTRRLNVALKLRALRADR